MGILNRYTKGGLAKALGCGVSLGVLVSAASGQSLNADPPLRLQTDYFGYAASVGGRLAYSDNITLAPDGFEEEEFIASTVFSAGAITSTRRFTGVLLADLDLSYLIDESDFTVSQDIGAAGTATVVDNWFYVDVAGQTSRQLLGDNARFSRNINAGRGEQANVHSFAVSPYLYHEMVDRSSASLRYRFSQLFVDDSDSVFGVLDRDFLNDSTSHEVIANYDTGGRFDRLRFSLSAYGADTSEDGSGVLPDFGYQQGAVEGAMEFALNRKFSISGAVGYDEIDTEDATALFFDDDELSGVFWRAGFTARPNRRLTARIEYGERYDDDFIDARVNYQLNQRTSFNAGANRTFETRAQDLTTRFRDTQVQILDYAALLREGGESSPRNVISAANQFGSVISGVNAQTVGVGITDTAFATFATARDRTQFTLGARYSDSDFGFRDIKTFSAGARVNRQLSRRLTGFLEVDFRRSDTEINEAVCIANPLVFGLGGFDPLFDPVAECAALAASNGVTNTIIGAVGADYRVFENVSAFAEYSYSQRWSEIDFLEYDENFVFVGLRVDF